MAPRSYRTTRLTSRPMGSTMTIPPGTRSPEKRGRRHAAGHVGEPHLDGGIRAGEVDAGQLAYGAPAAVAAGHVAGAYAPGAFRRGDVRVDPVGVLDEPGDLVTSAHLRTKPGAHAASTASVQRLRFPSRAVGAALDHPVVQRQPAEVADGNGVQLTEPRQQPALVELLDGPGRETKRARLPASARSAGPRTMVSTPARRSSPASISPVGPAPTTARPHQRFHVSSAYSVSRNHCPILRLSSSSSSPAQAT